MLKRTLSSFFIISLSNKIKIMGKFRRLFHVLLFVIKLHGKQKRKYTNTPYWFHLFRVAKTVYLTTKDEISTVVALAHDTLEDVEGCTHRELDRFFNEFYPPHEVKKIIEGIEHLTDEYVRISYPELNRKKRKQLEAERLGRIPAWLQTIKYADLIDNTKSIVKHDKDFSVVYLQEKEELLNQMRQGNAFLYSEAVMSLLNAQEKLKNNGK